MRTFKLSSNKFICSKNYGTCNISFSKLKKIFGDPRDFPQGNKVSTEWVFESDLREIVTIYDWKSTSLYDKDLPSVEDFRNWENYEWNIGTGNDGVFVDFINWLDKKLK